MTAASESMARDAGAELALQADARRFELEWPITKAARAGTIQPTGTMQKSARIGAHRRNVQIWQSCLFVDKGEDTCTP